MRPVESSATGGEGLPAPELGIWIEKARRRLYPFRPRFKDWRFWTIQLLVIAIFFVHAAVEAAGVLPALETIYFFPVSLFFVPVIYAALNFGFAGSVATSLWATAITLPNCFLWHSGAERSGEVFQLLIVNAVAVFVGQRVDREVKARRRAEATESARRVSEARYRSLFQSSPMGVLVVGPDGRVLDANPAAGALFERTRGAMQEVALADLIGAEDARATLASSDGGGRAPRLVLKRRDGEERYLEPVLIKAGEEGADSLIEILLLDLTEQVQRQAGLRAYAAHVLHAQEEERKRIAHELHDDAVQMLVLLCRKLDELSASEGSPPAAIARGLIEARQHTEQVVQRLRDFTWTLRPPVLDDLGLVTSIRRLVTDLDGGRKTSGRFRLIGEERRLTADFELGLFRIAQEALRNVERHARAANVEVILTFGERELRLDVIDNGIGFTQLTHRDGTSSGAHLGLMGMRERAEILGGSLQVHSTPGGGTRVSAAVPADPMPEDRRQTSEA